MNLSHAHPTLPTLDETDFVEVLFPGLDRPGLLHVPTMRVVPPVSGADDDDNEDGDKDDKGGKGKAGDDDDTDDDTDDGKKPKKGKKGADSDDDDDDDTPLARAQAALAATNAENRRLKKAAEDAESKAKIEAGEWKELYEEEKAKREALEADVESGNKTRLAEAALTTLGARKPAAYVKMLDLDKVEDEATAERAARKLLKSDPELFKKQATRQKRGAGGKSDDDDDSDTDDSKKPKRPVNRLRAGLAAGK